VPGMNADANELATPTLMRTARGVYAQSIRAQLHGAGFDDLPRNGAFILAGVDMSGGPRPDLPAELGVTKQAVSEAIDTLVRRGYLHRSPDTDDRRRIALALTERGQQAAAAIRRGAEAVDLKLRERLSAAAVDTMRSALMALTEIKTADIESGAGKPPLTRQLRDFSPVFPVRDLAAALAHYQALGFTTFPYEHGDEYGFANRDGVGVHLAANPGHDPAPGAAEAYLYVRDADALFEEWSRPEVGGHTHPVGAMEYRLREGSHTDPDGNVIRFGSPMDG
jgi:DNA-binding MarR family transcriptional regulator